MSSAPATSAELTAHGWELVETALSTARSEQELIIHWFETPTDTSVHRDHHYDDNDRVCKFVGLVVPTLAEQLQATKLAVAVPWDLTDEAGILVLVTAVAGDDATIDARALTRTALADAAPYWRLSEQPVAPPPQLAQIAAKLEV